MQFDPELAALAKQERERQARSISLIASENHTPTYCCEALGSCLAAKYSEGYPGNRYYAGNEVIDKIEALCQARALKAFGLDEREWGVNVQALSGSPANFEVYNALLEPNDRILSMDLAHGGHLSHGFQTPAKKVTATSKYFTCTSYRLDEKTEEINYDEIELLADRFRPKLIIAGYSAYPRLLDWARFRSIANNVGAILHADIAHIAGLIAAGVIPSAFPHCDIVTTTTHKTLRGPRGALIFSRKQFNHAIDSSVFPGCQGGPHNHTITAIAAALKAASEPEFKLYQLQVLKNAQALCRTLQKAGYRLLSNGTENHMVLVDLTPIGIRGPKATTALELVNIIANKNAVLKDRSARNPFGVRLGTPAMTSRGMAAEDFERVGQWITEVWGIVRMLDGKGDMAQDVFATNLRNHPRIKQIKKEVEEFAASFPVPPCSISRYDGAEPSIASTD